MINFIRHFKNLIEMKRFFKEKAAQGEPLCVMDDLVFKMMLTSDTEDSREALRHLLSACTRREISEVQVLNSELFPVYLGGKSPRLDVNVTFNDGEIADLEMQIEKSDDDLKNRASQYTAMLYAGQSKRGASYKGIKRVYQIFFLNHILFQGSDKLPRRYGYREEKEHDLLTDVTEIIFYELPKMEQHVRDYIAGKTGTESLSAEEKWCIFLKYRHEKKMKPLIEELCLKEEGIMHAEKEVVKVSRSFKKYIREMSEMKDEIDHWHKMEAVRKEGLEKGHAEGHVIGREDERKYVLDLISQGFSAEEIKRRLERTV